MYILVRLQEQEGLGEAPLQPPSPPQKEIPTFV